MIRLVKYVKEAPDGPISCSYIDVINIRVLIAISAVNWYTKGKPRKIPIWISRKGLFAWRLAIKIGRLPKREAE